jgi:spoIIIJ-associated protein
MSEIDETTEPETTGTTEPASEVTDAGAVSADDVETDEAVTDEAELGDTARADDRVDSDDSDDPDASGDAQDGKGRTSLQERLEQEGDIAADYLEELLDIADLDGDLDLDVEGERAVVSIVGADLSQLVGANGEVLDALQELTRLAVYRETGERSRLMLDVSGHRAQRRRELEELAAETAARVKESGERAALRAMTPFERKVVHDAVAAAGLTSESEGVEPRRYVVVLPA